MKGHASFATCECGPVQAEIVTSSLCGAPILTLPRTIEAARGGVGLSRSTSLSKTLFGLGNDMDQGGGKAGEDILMTSSIAAAMYEIFGARAHDVAIRQIELPSDRQAVTDRWQAISRALEALISEAKDGRKPGCG